MRFTEFDSAAEVRAPGLAAEPTDLVLLEGKIVTLDQPPRVASALADLVVLDRDDLPCSDRGRAQSQGARAIVCG